MEWNAITITIVAVFGIMAVLLLIRFLINL